jgi:flagellar biosynthesis/type III secretory pathway M-ring protein FliF/YscJ
MDTQTMLEAWGELGVIGVMALLFGFMITNIIKSQNAQNESLDKMAVDQAKSSETVDNVEGILLKLLQRMDKSDDKLDRKVDDLKRSLSDIDNDLSEVKGSVSRINGRH